MDKIYLNQMAFYGYHGVFSEENKLGQRFIVDVILESDLRPAGETDDLEKTVNYGDVYQQAKSVIEGPPVKLVESLTEQLAQALLDNFPLVVTCHVKVIKPDPPIAGHYESVAVEMTRSRKRS